jgi:DNA primase
MNLLLDYLESTGRFDRLREGPRNITACCPFAAERHEKGTDRNPSWGINKENGLWHCFSCKSGGNLPQLIHQLNLPGLISTDGVLRLPNFRAQVLKFRQYTSETPSSEQAFFPLPASFRLFSGRAAGITWPTLEYLYDKGVSWESIQCHGIGYCYLNKDVIYPIADPEGYQVAWQRRSITGRRFEFPDHPFDQSRLLFNLDRLNENEKPLVVESIKAAIILEQWGWPAVSCFNSYLSEQQAALLLKFNELTLLFDGDIPGMVGQERALDLLRHKFLGDVYWANLPLKTPSESSPDDYPRKIVEEAIASRKHMRMSPILSTAKLFKKS